MVHKVKQTDAPSLFMFIQTKTMTATVAERLARRDAGIDMLRALTMFTMIFVNDFWKIHDVPRWLEHARWGEDFMGLADVVFPAFLFAVGMSVPYSLGRRFARGYPVESTVGHILSRTFALIVMGAFITNSEARLSPEAPYPIGVYWFIMAAGFIGIWNAYPKPSGRGQAALFAACRLAGAGALVYLALTFRNPDGGVFGPQGGILGAIGWTYLVCAMVYLFCRDNLRRLAAVWGVFVLICLLGSPLRDSFGGKAILDFPRPNFYNGLLGMLHIGNGACCVMTMSGLILSVVHVRLAGRSESWRISRAMAVAVLFAALGAVSWHFWIVSKIGATPPWVFTVIALSVALYAVLSYLAAHRLDGWFAIIRPAGAATLTAYIVPYVFYGFSDVTGIVLPDWATHGVPGLINCACFSLLAIAVTGLLGRLHIKLKI